MSPNINGVKTNPIIGAKFYIKEWFIPGNFSCTIILTNTEVNIKSVISSL